jgi:hypothetical protein
MKIGLALTWDGSRWPARSLPAKARAFLAGKDIITSGRRAVARLMADDGVEEIRICWVPSLMGGDDVLTGPFSAKDGKRIPFKVAQTKLFGEICGVVYRR